MEKRYFIGDFSCWMIIVPSDRPSSENRCKLLSADILVRKVLGLKKVVIQSDPSDERSVGAALEMENAFKRNGEHVKIVHCQTAAMHAFESIEVL